MALARRSLALIIKGSVIGHSRVVTAMNKKALLSCFLASRSFKKALTAIAKVMPAKVQYAIAIDLIGGVDVYFSQSGCGVRKLIHGSGLKLGMIAWLMFITVGAGHGWRGLVMGGFLTPRLQCKGS